MCTKCSQADNSVSPVLHKHCDCQDCQKCHDSRRRRPPPDQGQTGQVHQTAYCPSSRQKFTDGQNANAAMTEAGRQRDVGCRMQDAGCRMQDAGNWNRKGGEAGSGCRMQDVGCKRVQEPRGSHPLHPFFCPTYTSKND